MRFRQWQQVLDGTKTQTRRPVKENEFIGHATWTVVEDRTAAQMGRTDLADIPAVLYYPWFLGFDERMKWCVGRTYAVQPPGKKSVGRIRITKIRRERLADISEEDCWAEGIPLGQIFDEVQGIPFDCYKCPVCHRRYQSYLDAYACLWNHIYGNGAWERMKDDDVWVLEFELVEEKDG